MVGNAYTKITSGVKNTTKCTKPKISGIGVSSGLTSI